MSTSLPYRIFSLGDTALTIDFGNTINEVINGEVQARFKDLQQDPLPGMIEAVPAYSSLTLYFDLLSIKKESSSTQTRLDLIKAELEERLMQPVDIDQANSRVVRIPVCYDKEFAPDLEALARSSGLTTHEVIHIHTSKTYKVYMLGFLPGFPYMGEVDDRIVMSRKQYPVNVEAGSIGIAGKQTGIYPLDSPGGWQIIGRTPLRLFDATKERSTLLQTGDTIQFYSISKNEFEDH
jgi:inhibitor of KinA